MHLGDCQATEADLARLTFLVNTAGYEARLLRTIIDSG